MTTDNSKLDCRFESLLSRSASAGIDAVFANAGGDTASLIANAEHQLAVIFEPTLRRYLERFNGGHIAGFELTWLVEANSCSWPDLVFATESSRAGGLCTEYDVHVASDDDCYYFVRNGPTPADIGVYERQAGPRAHPIRFAKNYIEFLEIALDRYIA